MHVIKVVSLCRSRIKLAYQTHYVGDVRYIHHTTNQYLNHPYYIGLWLTV